MFYTAENKDNGFVDRLLLCYPDLEVEHYNENEMNEKVIEFYESAILHFFNSVKSILNFDNEGEIEPVLCKWTAEAKKEWVRIFNSITDIQNSDEENEYLKSMYPKQKSYIPRFSLLINAFNFGTDTIEQESILKAERLSNYFIEMAKKIKVGSTQNNEIKKIVEKSKSKTSFEQFADIFKENTQINKTQMAELFGVSRQTIINWSKKCN
jgi:DNA-binding transcriptional regulator YiaG